MYNVSHYTPASYICLFQPLGFAVPWSMLQVAGLSPRWSGFDSSQVHVRFMVSRDTVEEYFGLPLYSSSNNVPSSTDIRKTCGRVLGTCKQSGAHFNIGEHRIWKVLSLGGLRSRLFDSHNCWLAPTKNQRPVACPVTARYMCPSCHAELWVSYFEPKSERHSVEGTTQRLQGRDNWGQLHLTATHLTTSTAFHATWRFVTVSTTVRRCSRWTRPNSFPLRRNSPSAVGPWSVCLWSFHSVC